METLFTNGTFTIERLKGETFFMFGDEYSFELSALSEFLAALRQIAPVDYRALQLCDTSPHQR